MLCSRPFIVDGEMWGSIYTFEHAGDVFPTHTHTEDTNHISVLAHGSLRCTGHPKYEGVVIEARPGGTIINWIAGEPHGFVALTDGATLLNMPKKRHGNGSE